MYTSCQSSPFANVEYSVSILAGTEKKRCLMTAAVSCASSEACELELSTIQPCRLYIMVIENTSTSSRVVTEAQNKLSKQPIIILTYKCNFLKNRAVRTTRNSLVILNTRALRKDE